MLTVQLVLHCLLLQGRLCEQCKHQLAARLAESLQCCQTVCIPDEVLAQLLIAT